MIGVRAAHVYVTVQVAVPLLRAWVVHPVMGVPPSAKLTVPVGLRDAGATGATVAV